MREAIDQGLQELQATQGKGGWPTAPSSSQGKPTQTQFAAIAPPSDPKDAADIQAQNQLADQAETEVAATVGHENGSAAGPANSASAPTVALGQSQG